MPDTHGFEAVSEVRESVLREMLQSAWDNGGTNDPGSIPHEVSIDESAGLSIGPYPIQNALVSIPRDGVDLDMAPADNGIKVILETDGQVNLKEDSVPVDSLKLLNFDALIGITAPIGVIPGSQVDLGVILRDLLRNKITVTLTSGHPVTSITTEMIREYIHKLYENNTIPHFQTFDDQTWNTMTFDVFVEIFDDENDPAHQITVSQPEPDKVSVSIPIHVRLSDISNAFGPDPLSPMGIEALAVITVPYQQSVDEVAARLTSLSRIIEVQNIQPYSGIEGTNYNINKTAAAALGIDLEMLFRTEITNRIGTILNTMGDIKIDIPTVAEIETLIGDFVHEEVKSREFVGTWTPETPEGSPVEIREVRPKALSDALAIAVNAVNGANENAIGNFIPSAEDFGIALDGGFIVDEIGRIVNLPESEGGLGGIPKTFNDVEGYKAKLRELHWELRDGAIHFWGECTVYDVFCGADADASFWVDIGLRWTSPDSQGAQSLEPYVIDKDVDLPWWAWLLVVIGFIISLIVGIVVLVVVIVVERIAERVGGGLIEDEVGGKIQALGAWPQSLKGIGTVTSVFREEVGIDPSGLLFAGSMSVIATYSQALTSTADTGGPYYGKAQYLLAFHAESIYPIVVHGWKLGDGQSSSGHQISHTYIDDGKYVVRLESIVNEAGGAKTHHFCFANIKDVPPEVNAGIDRVANEGEEITFVGTFSDKEWVDTHEAVWDFGDDSLPEKGTVTETNNPPHAVGTVTGKHAFCDNGTYTVTLQVRDKDGGIGKDTLKVTVKNVAPTVTTGGVIYAYPCTPVNLIADFTDPGWCDTHTAKWKFGDCNPPVPGTIREVNEPPIGYGIAVATHRYANCGTYHAECTVTDDDGDSGSAILAVEVIDVRNKNFEDGFRNRDGGQVANEWEPFYGSIRPGITASPSGTGHSYGDCFKAEEFIVRDGQRSQRILLRGSFTAGILQAIGANSGWDYQVTVWYHVDGRTKGTCFLGVNPNGGVDPESANIEWVSGTEFMNWEQLACRVTAKGDAITIFLKSESDGEGANTYFDHVLLDPYPCPLPPLEPPEEPEPEPEPEEEERCVDWKDDKGSRDVGAIYENNGFVFRSRSNDTISIVTWGDPQHCGKMVVLQRGIDIVLPFTADHVVAHVIFYSKKPILMEAFDQKSNQIGKVLAPDEQRRIHELEIKASGIELIRLSGGDNEGLLIDLCIYGKNRVSKKYKIARRCQ